MIKVYCDFCKKEIDKSNSITYGNGSITELWLELCDDCYIKALQTAKKLKET